MKLVYYQNSESIITDDVKERIYSQIRAGRTKRDFDFMEVFQFIPENKKRAFTEEFDNENISTNQQIISLFRQAEKQVYCFSGNLSFVNIEEKGTKLLDILEELLKRKIFLKIITKINISSTDNLNKLKLLMNKYPNQIDIRHSTQPLRGFIIDDKIARFKDEEYVRTYKKGELYTNIRIFYEFYDSEWILWMQKIFWNLFRASTDYLIRIKEIERIS